MEGEKGRQLKESSLQRGNVETKRVAKRDKGLTSPLYSLVQDQLCLKFLKYSGEMGVNIIISVDKTGVKNGLTQCVDSWADPTPLGTPQARLPKSNLNPPRVLAELELPPR